MKLTIATFNIQNKYKINKYDGLDNYGDHVIELKKFIYDNNIDILGVQELTRRFKNRLIKFLGNYNILGNMRFTRFLNIFPAIDRFNEYNSIITKKQVINKKTKYIPFFPSIPRIVTIVDCLINDEVIRVINTHLSHNNSKVRKRQLNKILKLMISNTKTILMGDFNTTVADIDFNCFMKKLDELGYKRVDVNKATHRINKSPIDHIFVHKSMKTKSVKVCDLKEKISDHKPIIVELML